MPPTHTPTIPPMSIKDISMFLYRKQFFSSFPFTFLDLIKFKQFGNAAQFLWIFLLYIHAPLSVLWTMPTVNSIESKCLCSIRSDSFIQWNPTVPPFFFKFQQIYLTHSVQLIPSLQLIQLNPFPCPQFQQLNQWSKVW